MAFRVARIARAKSGALKARKAIPEDVRNDYQALYGKRREELFRAPPACSPQGVNALHGAWLAEIESRIDATRIKQRGSGHNLTAREARAGWRVVSLVRQPTRSRLKEETIAASPTRRSTVLALRIFI
jgi:hypothetical protein